MIAGPFRGLRSWFWDPALHVSLHVRRLKSPWRIAVVCGFASRVHLRCMTDSLSEPTERLNRALEERYQSL